MNRQVVFTVMVTAPQKDATQVWSDGIAQLVEWSLIDWLPSGTTIRVFNEDRQYLPS